MTSSEPSARLAVGADISFEDDRIVLQLYFPSGARAFEANHREVFSDDNIVGILFCDFSGSSMTFCDTFLLTESSRFRYLRETV